MIKRMKKLKGAEKEGIPPRLWGQREAKIGIIGFGSTLGSIVEAMKALHKKGIQSKFLQMRTLWPFPSREVSRFLAGCQKAFVVENNFTGQLSRLLRSQIEPGPKIRSILKFSSQAFKSQEIVKEIEKAL